jgi:hypothetical protein
MKRDPLSIDLLSVEMELIGWLCAATSEILINLLDGKNA